MCVCMCVLDMRGLNLNLSTLPGGPAYCTEHRGDWKWLREALQLSAHWSATAFCHRCVARKTGFNRTLVYATF